MGEFDAFDFLLSSVNPIRLTPVFSGKTEEDVKIVLYKRIISDSELHIRVGDNPLRALSPGSEIISWFELGDNNMHIALTSPEWTGQATGSRLDLMEEPGIR